MKASEAETARILDECVNKILREGQSIEDVLLQYPDLQDDLQEALLAASWMAKRQEPAGAVNTFVWRSRPRLLARLEARAEQPKQRGWFWSWNGSAWLRAALMGLVVLLLASLSGVVYAAKGSLPGETFYPVKLAIEDMAVSLIRDPVARNSYSISQLDTRLTEVEDLAARSDYENVDQALVTYEAAVQTAVAEMDNQSLTPAQKEQLALKLQEKLVDHLTHLEQLRVKLPAQAQRGVDRAITVSSHGLTMAQYATSDSQLTATPTLTRTATSMPTKTPEPSQQADEQPTKTKGNNKPTDSPGSTATEQTKGKSEATPGPPDKTTPAEEHKPTQKPKPTHPDTGSPPKPTKTPKDK